MSVRERNHVVPEMLSKSWTDGSGRFFWYNKLDARRGIQSVTPGGAFWKKRLYVQEDHSQGPNGEIVKSKDDWVEVHLGRSVEGPAEPVLSAIIEAVRLGGAPSINESDRRILERFFACQWTRSPNTRDSIMSVEEAQAVTEELARRIVAERGYPLDEAELRLLRPETVSRVRANAFVHYVGEPGDGSLAVLRRSGLFFLSAPPGTLVIGSDPVAEFPDGRELGVGDAVAVLPVAPDVAVAFGPADCDSTLLKFRPDDLRGTNERIVGQSDSIAATCEDLIRSLIPELAC